MAKLTMRRLDAINTALAFYLAGEPNDGDRLARKDYEQAQDWVLSQIEKREKRRAALAVPERDGAPR